MQEKQLTAFNIHSWFKKKTKLPTNCKCAYLQPPSPKTKKQCLQLTAYFQPYCLDNTLSTVYKILPIWPLYTFKIRSGIWAVCPNISCYFSRSKLLTYYGSLYQSCIGFEWHVPSLCFPLALLFLVCDFVELEVLSIFFLLIKLV